VSYDFTLKVEGMAGTDVRHIEVRDGKVSKVVHVSGPMSAGNGMTIDDIFAVHEGYLKDGVGGRTTTMLISYDSFYGYPTQIRVDCGAASDCWWNNYVSDFFIR